MPAHTERKFYITSLTMDWDSRDIEAMGVDAYYAAKLEGKPTSRFRQQAAEREADHDAAHEPATFDA